jgi:putative RNA 2'-phosphotransferase
MKPNLMRLSKFMSLVLRHAPDTVGLTLDECGWVAIDDLVSKARAGGVTLTREIIMTIVTNDAKGRYAVSEDGMRIRATYGHSLDVNLGLDPQEPPEHLFHGTATHALDSIKRDGLTRKRRQYVHLSADRTTAITVGGRHGRPVVITVEAGRMYQAGFEFYHSESGIWLTECVPPVYLDLASLDLPPKL